MTEVGERRRWRDWPNRHGAMTVLRVDTLNGMVLVKWDDRTTAWLADGQYLNETEPVDG